MARLTLGANTKGMGIGNGYGCGYRYGLSFVYCFMAKVTVDKSLGHYGPLPTLLLYSPYAFLAGIVMVSPLLMPNSRSLLISSDFGKLAFGSSRSSTVYASTYKENSMNR